MLPPFSNFTSKAKQAIQRAHELAIERGQSHVASAHLLGALLTQDDTVVVAVIETLNVDTETLVEVVMDQVDSYGIKHGDINTAPQQLYLTGDFAEVLEESMKIMQNLKDEWVSVEHLFMGLLAVSSDVSPVLEKFKINKDSIMAEFARIKEHSQKSGVSSDPETTRLKTLKKFSRNLTELATQDKLDPVIGRDREIMRIVEILSRRTKNNPILIGEPGTGKTAIAEGLAIRISKNDVPESLKGKEVYALDLGMLVAGTKYRGEFEERVKKVMKEVEQASGSVIMFIDEIHTLIGAGSAEGSMDAANMLKPALSRGEFRVVGATTINEYQKYFERDAALTRRFQSVVVDEPSMDDAVAILRGLKYKYELFHGVRITDDAIISAVNLSSRYITDRFLPDKAVDLIDEAASALRISLENKPATLDEAERKIKRLEIEIEALKRESEGDTDHAVKVRSRMGEVQTEIAEVRDAIKDLATRWKAEKELLSEIGELKKQLAHSHVEAEQAELRTDLSRVAEIRYGSIPQLEKTLAQKQTKLTKLQKTRRVLREEVTEEDIASVVSRWTHVPVSRMLEAEIAKLARMEDELKQRVKGQDEAIVKISHAIRRARVGISDPNKPIGSFLFMGPTGVGKTELTKALAEFLFDDEKALIRVDMSEFMERHSVAKLLGAPPGYVGHDEGGKFTEMIRHRPYSVVLFDEVEKAHPEVFNVLLQVLDDGRLTDGKGRVINFKNTVIVMTSNIGSQHIQKMQSMGFRGNSVDEYGEVKERVMDSLKQHFRPEFINRIDEIVVFDTLGVDTVRDIVRAQLAIVAERLTSKDIAISFDESVVEHLSTKGYDPMYGARPLKRLIQSEVLNPIAHQMVKGGYGKNAELVVSYTEAGGVLVKEKTVVRVRRATKSPVTVG